MPQIILRINQNDNKIIADDKVCCYIAKTSLNDNKTAEIVNTGKMVLAQGDHALEFCLKNNLDGVVFEVDDKKPIKAQLKPLREKLSKKTFGVIIPPRRHEAMLASEVEPEFVALKIDDLTASQSLIDWYNELFLLPLALDFNEKIPPLQSIKTEFVIIDAEKFKNSGC